jgi:hypothetical protein
MLSLLLVACEPESDERYESRDPPVTDPTDDTGSTIPMDVDADGWTAKDGDCDDANPAVHPGAYDRPGDGIDEDCADGDRTCDCVVLDVGTTTTEAFQQFDSASRRSLDIGFLLDTTCGSQGPPAVAEAFPDVVDALAALPIATTTMGLATFDDYAYGSYGSSAYGDTPFLLRAQQTDDPSVVRDALNATPIHGGSDGTEAGIEALYQALTGAGYDQDCDATYDGPTDVKPFIADPTDPFGGVAGQFYDSTDQSTGNVGGMGFRADATVRVVVYTTDNYMRDPAAGYPSPGGCPADADADDVGAAALASGVYLIGIGDGSTLALEQMRALADATGSLADVDGDGEADDPLAYFWWGTTAEMGETIVDAVDALRSQTGLRDVFTSVSLELRNDPLGIVEGIFPDGYTDVAWDDVDTLVFNVAYYTDADGAKPVVGSVDFALVGDGFDLTTVHVDVEIAPL